VKEGVFPDVYIILQPNKGAYLQAGGPGKTEIKGVEEGISDNPS
jgi:hypothetical protein